MKNRKPEGPLAEWLRAASPEQRDRAAKLAGTSENYMRQIASFRREPSVGLAFAIEDAIAVLHEESAGLLPLITARELAEAKALAGL